MDTNYYYQRNRFRKSENILFDSPEEECGVFGVYSTKNIDTFSLVQFGLFALQHRGQEACGFSVLKEGTIYTVKQSGLVLDAFKSVEDTENYQGNAAIGHNRYTTAGDKKRYNYQPLFAKNEYDRTILSIVHNGNLVGIDELRNRLEKEGVNFLATSDTEVMLRLLQKHLSNGLENAIKESAKYLKGAFSVLTLTKEKLVAFRDPNGIRPLCIGVIDENTYVFASESCALDGVGAQYLRDVMPGEMVIVDKNGLRSEMIYENPIRRICSFEYIYFARPDSIIENIEVYKVREKSGEKLYEQSPVEADLVIGVPDSGIPAAIGYSKASKIPFMPVLIKNRYIGRSFIVPTQEMRERVVNLKLNPIESEIKGKRIIIIDDSIVRGTTSKRLVKILQEAGATEIHFRSASPAIIAPCYLGIDTPDKTHLISSQKSKEELKNYLNVNSLDFLSLENLYEILGSKNHCFGCFTEKYPVSKD